VRSLAEAIPRKLESVSPRGIAAAPRLMLIFIYGAPVAQLDRASGYEPEGREFESPRAHHTFKHLQSNQAMALAHCSGNCSGWTCEKSSTLGGVQLFATRHLEWSRRL
jgi:hypothetical protein